MDTDNKTINNQLRPCAIKIMREGITEQNCEEIINLLQSILEAPFDEIFNDIDFCFLITSLYYIQLNSPMLELFKNNLRDRFLYFQLLKLDNDEISQTEWVIKREIVEHKDDGYKEIIQYNINQRTNEKIELSRQRIENLYNSNLDAIFTGLLQDEEKSLTENELQ